MIRRPPGSTGTDPRFPSTTLFRFLRAAVFFTTRFLAAVLRAVLLRAAGLRAVVLRAAVFFLTAVFFLAAVFRAVVLRAVVLRAVVRSEEHTSELQSLMRISYAVFCVKKKKQSYTSNSHDTMNT